MSGLLRLEALSAQETSLPTESPEKALGWSLLFSPLPSLSSLSVRVSQLFALDFLEIFQGKGRKE